MKARDIPYYLLLAVAGSFVLPMKLNTLLLAALVLSVLVFFPKNRHVFSRPLFYLPLLLFALLLLSILNSDDRVSAWFYTERKLSLLAVPLLFAFFRFDNEKQYLTVLRVSVISVALAGLYCLGFAVSRFAAGAATEVFFYHTFASALKFNAIYLSAYCLLSLVLMGVLAGKLFPGRLLRIVLYLFTAFMLVLLSSKMLLLLWLLHVLYLILSRKEILLKWRVSALLLYLLVPVLILAVPFVRNRVVAEFQQPAFFASENYSHQTPFTGLSLRVAIGRHVMHIMEEKKAWFFGTGTGDFQQLLDEKYRQSGMYTGSEAIGDRGYLGYNPHNQYLEIMLVIGIIGLIVFLIWLGSLLYMAVRGKNELLITLLLIFMMMCLSESVLSTNKGIVWFLFFVYLFLNRLFFDERSRGSNLASPNEEVKYR